MLPVFASAQGPGLDFFVNGELQKEQGKYKEAIESYSKAIEKEPGNLKYMTQKCQCLMDAREIKASVSCFEEITKLHKDNIETYETLANLYSMVRKNKEAVASYEKAIALSKESDAKFVYLLQIIHIFQQANKIGDAGKYLDEARKIIGDHFDILFLQASYYNAVNQPSKAFENMKKVMTELGNPPVSDEFAKYYFELGLSQYKLQNYADALANFEKANFDPYKAQIKPLLPESISKTGEAYYNSLFYEQAKKYANDALKVVNNYDAAKKLLEKTEKVQEMRPDVLEKMAKAANAEQNPTEKVKLLENLAMSSFNMNGLSDCIKYCDDALKINPKNHTVIYLQCIAKHLSGESDPALHLLDILTKIPNLPNDLKMRCFFALGVIFKSKNDAKQAYLAFKKASFGAFTDAANFEIRELKQGTQISDEEGDSE
jgi:tetratricopeptide (TPR) repeat protein